MKRITALALSLLFALELAACAGNSTPETDPASDGDAEVTAAPELQAMEYRSVTKVGPGNKLLYVNDLELNGCADPSVITVEENGRTCFYLYCTGIRGYYSYDLVSWISLDSVFPKPSGSWSKADYWAPEVIYDEEAGLYRMFYSASSAEGYFFVSMATSSSPKGPFRQWTGTNADGLEITEKTPIFDFSRMDPSHPLYEGVIRAIDAHPFVDPATGDKYLYWVRGWNAGGTVQHDTSEIWAVRMKDWATPDYSTVTRLTEVAKKTVGGEKTEHTEQSINEGPSVLYHDGTYYLTFSVNPASYKGYSVWQAVSDSPLGPFTKLERNEGGLLLGVDSAWDHMSGTGHHAFCEIGGELYIFYHAHTERTYTSMGDRAFAFDRVLWRENDNGQTVLHANGPTWSPQPQPSVISGCINAAPEADVSVSGASPENVSRLTDGLINMHKRGGVAEAQLSSDSVITLQWDAFRELSALLIYNSIDPEKAFAAAERIEFVCRTETGEEIRVIENASFDTEKYTGGPVGQKYIRPGSALVLRLSTPTPVREIRIHLTGETGQTTLALSEIIALAAAE
ncbi:MAG: family 43 glycosylhydrolase [Eubacteriales bacterium]